MKEKNELLPATI